MSIVTWYVLPPHVTNPHVCPLSNASEPRISVPNPLLQILGLQIGASKADIKKAYKKLALQWHPDKHLGAENLEEIVAKFQAIQKVRLFKAMV